MPYVAVSVHSYSLKPKTTPLKAEYHPCFVKIVRKKNHNFGLTLRKRLFCIVKQPLLPCKTAAFGMQNNRFCKALINRRLCDSCACEKYLQLLCCLLAMNWWIARSGGGVIYYVSYG